MGVPYLFLTALVANTSSADLEIRAEVSDDCSVVTVSSQSVVPPVAADAGGLALFLPANAYRTVPPMTPVEERSLFPKGHSTGGFRHVVLTTWRANGSVQGVPLNPTETETSTAVLLSALPSDTQRYSVRAVLDVPKMAGPLGLHRRRLTLGGLWFPWVGQVATPSLRRTIDVRVRLPAGYGALVGSRYYPPVPVASPRWVGHREEAASVPLVLVSPDSKTLVTRSGGMRWVHPWIPASSPRHGEHRTILEVLDDGEQFLRDEGILAPTRDWPLVLVEAPLRHNLAHATDGGVLVSDRAFRLLPVDRLLRFHRFALLREVFTAVALRNPRIAGPYRHVIADAVGAWLLNHYAAKRLEEKEDAFDVLQLWSFIPAIDSLLYAPQLPFVEAYFRLIKEEDPLRPNLVDFPSTWPRGKVLYEKLLDRLGARRTHQAFEALFQGQALDSVLAEHLGSEHRVFLKTWLGPYPNVRYGLADYGSRALAPGGPYEVQVSVTHEGDPIAEPVTVKVESEDGETRFLQLPPSDAPIRVLTATLGSALDFVEVDPFGRLSETPTEDQPSPRYDNRSTARWRFVLQSFNFALSPTAGTLNSAIDVGIAQVREVHWRYGVRVDFGPDVIGVSGRMAYAFGPAVTPDRLLHQIGLALSGEYLRPGFAATPEDAFALATTLFFRMDNRLTLWAPEAGHGLRAALSYNRVIVPRLSDASGVSEDALSLTFGALKSWRFAGLHQLSLRGTWASFLFGEPRNQILFALGGRSNVRGYGPADLLTRVRAVLGAEWVHPLVTDWNENFLYLVWVTGLDGALFVDGGFVADSLTDLGQGRFFADAGYGFRIYIDYFGARLGVLAVDVALPLVDLSGGLSVGPPAVYIDFAQSFLAF
jgi:hypothetical protein